MMDLPQWLYNLGVCILEWRFFLFVFEKIFPPCMFLSLLNNGILKFPLMGCSGNWLKSLIAHKKAQIKDHVSSDFWFSFCFSFFFVFVFVFDLVSSVCFRKRVVVTGRENGGYGGALRGVQS